MAFGDYQDDSGFETEADYQRRFEESLFDEPVTTPEASNPGNPGRDPNELADAAGNRGVGGPSTGGGGGPKTGYDLEGFRNRWIRSGNIADPMAWLKANQDITSGVTLRGAKAYDPSGKFIADLVGNSKNPDKSKHSRIFLDGIDSKGRPRTSSRVNPTAMPAPASSGAGGASGAGGNTVNAITSNGPKYSEEIYKYIMKMLAQGSEPLAIDDPNIQANFAPTSAVMQRGAERAKLAAAERHAFQGTSHGGAGGGLDAESAGIDERLALGEGELMAQLRKDELAARRKQLVDALSFAQGEEKLALTAKLAQMDDELDRLTLRQNESQFARTHSQRDRHFNSNIGFNYANLGQQNDHFYDTFNRDNSIWDYLKNEGLFDDLRDDPTGGA